MKERDIEAPKQAEDNKRTQDLRTQPIPKLLLRYAIPAVVGTVVQALYNIVDTIFIGQGSGELGIAAVYIGFPLIILLVGFSMLVGTGASVGVSIALGRRDSDRADRILSNADFTVFFHKLSLVQPRIGFSRSSLGSFCAIHLRYSVIREIHLSEHQTNVQQLIEAIEEAFYPIPLFRVNLHGLFQFGNGSVSSFNSILQTHNLLADFGFLLV